MNNVTSTMNIEYSSAQAFVDDIRERGCLVFGTGFVATLLLEALDEAGVRECVEGYLVSKLDSVQEYDGKDVREASDESVNRESLVCIAVHESNRDSAVETLQQLGYTCATWAYPYLYDLIYGTPRFSGIWLETERVLNAQNPEYSWLAVRALAAEALYAESKLLSPDRRAAALDAYLKAQTLHCSPETAKQRLSMLEVLVNSMRMRGFDADRPVLVDTNMSIIDGLHRLAVAWLLGIERIPCDIVKANPVFDKLLTERNKMTHSELVRAGLTQAQFDEIEAMWVRMRCDYPSPSISVIMPAFNVADYLDQCLESVVRQTFGDFEVLLIDDGSTDGTGELCEDWSRRDWRIHCIRKANSGVSPSRNLGIELARGTYLAFVDPDDWLDLRYLEKLHDAAFSEDADFAECDIWRYDNRNGTKIHRSCGQRMGVRYTLEEHMKYGPTASYKSITKRSLWIENDVRFPECSFESPAVYALVLALAGEKSVYVPEPLYYYRRFRENSLVETAYAKTPGVADNTLGVEAMAHLCAQFNERGLYERFASVMPGLVTYRLNDILAMQYHRRSADDFAQLVANQRKFLEQAFPQLPQGTYLTWGSYNLGKILQHLPMLNDPSCRFNFSSIVAIAHGSEQSQESIVHHKNRYRAMMVERELDQVFWDVLEQQKPSFIFMDFVEERFDLVEWNARFVTISDAFEDAEIEGFEPLRHVRFGTEEHLSLWMKSFDAFATRLSILSPDTQLVIVENYLSERVGSLVETREYEDIADIRTVNGVLKSMYDYARGKRFGIDIVRAYTCPDYFTDEAYEYGAVPQHLNDIVNQRIAHMVEEVICRGE